VGLEESLTPYERFLQSIDNVDTRKNYDYGMKSFLRYAKITADDLMKASPTAIEDAIRRQIRDMENQGLSWGTRAAVVNGLWKFCKVNKLKEVDFDEIRKTLGDDESEHDDQPYDNELVRKLMQAADLRKKVIIGVLATSGIRRGAIASLKLKHAHKMTIPESTTETYALDIYANSKKDRYATFITPEVSALLDAYLKARVAAGEVLSPDSPLIREQYDPTANRAADTENVNKPRHVTTSTVAQLVTALIIQAGLKDEIRKRKIHAMHAFRKHVYTELIKAGVKEVNVKRIIGHSTGLGRNYDRQTLEDMLKDYAKVIPALTISNEPELQRQVEKLRVELSDVSALKAEMYRMKQELDTLKRANENAALVEANRDKVPEVAAPAPIPQRKKAKKD
jgi:integrase